MSNAELKPCPFCGGEAKVYETNMGIDFCSSWWNVECNDCEAMMEGFGSEKIAIRVWNTRAEQTCRNLYNVVSGKYSKFFECSNCDYVDYEIDRSDWNYCPSCGYKIKQ